MHCVDMNAWDLAADRPERPDFVLFDLDPPGRGFAFAARVAHLIRELLDEVGLACYAKTSGADGVHVLVPIARRHDHGQARRFAVAASSLLEQRHPELVTTEWLKEKRGDAVLVDATRTAPAARSRRSTRCARSRTRRCRPRSPGTS